MNAPKMNLPPPTAEDIARMFGCTVAQVKALHARNAAQLAEMADKAERTGKKVNHYTAAQLREMSAAALERSR